MRSKLQEGGYLLCRARHKGQQQFQARHNISYAVEIVLGSEFFICWFTGILSDLGSVDEKSSENNQLTGPFQSIFSSAEPLAHGELLWSLDVWRQSSLVVLNNFF